MTKIKICGLFREQDIEYVNRAKPDYAGFIVNFPKSHRNVGEDQLRKLTEKLHQEICSVGVFVDAPLEQIARLQRENIITVAQLHGRETNEDIERLRQLNGGKPIWKAFSVGSQEDLQEAMASEGDLILLDNGKGTGQCFDWSLIAQVERPYLLAGGITPENIQQAITRLHPYGLDVSSGAETNRQKDFDKIQEIVRKVRYV